MMFRNDDDNGCSDAHFRYQDKVSDGLYVFTVLAGIAAIAAIVLALT